jgi:hypothetical protein
LASDLHGFVPIPNHSELVSGCRSSFEKLRTAVDAFRQDVGFYPGGTASGVLLHPAPVRYANEGIANLLGTARLSNEKTAGSWLFNDGIWNTPGSYNFAVSTDGTGTINVLNGDGAALGTTPASCDHIG